MTISDDERREVAAKLRALEPWAHFEVGEPITREEVENVLGFEYVIGDSYDAADIRRLADLIDRPTRRPSDLMKWARNDNEIESYCSDNYDDFPIEYVGRTRYTTRCESKILNSMTYNN